MVPPLPAQFVDSLEAIGVRTESDLLFYASPFKLYKQLPAGSFGYHEVLNWISVVEGLCTPLPTTGKQLSATQPLRPNLQTGIPQIDDIIGRLDTSGIIEISGERSCGKTTLAIRVVMTHLASHRDASALWLDTSGDFSVARALKYLPGVEKTQILERLHISLAFDTTVAQDSIQAIISGELGLRPSILVIDTITPLFAPFLTAASAQGHALMTDFMRQVSTLAREHNCAVLVINNATRKGADTFDAKPALGPSFSLLCDTVLWLRRLEGDGGRFFTLQALEDLGRARGISKPFELL